MILLLHLAPHILRYLTVPSIPVFDTNCILSTSAVVSTECGVGKRHMDENISPEPFLSERRKMRAPIQVTPSTSAPKEGDTREMHNKEAYI